jgi:anti-anti-sigma factor
VAPSLEDVQVERPADGTAVVVFSGEHDMATEREVSELLHSLVRWDKLIVADFSSASFVDSSMLGVLLDANEQARELGKTFRLQLGTAAIVHRAFEICGVFVAIERVTTREEALVPGER